MRLESAMNRSQKLILDTSGLNHLADDPDCTWLLAGITSGYFPRTTSTIVEEIAATDDDQRKRHLLDLCQGGRECYSPHGSLFVRCHALQTPQR